MPQEKNRPMGMGPITGCGMGFCRGRINGHRESGRHGFRNMFNATGLPGIMRGWYNPSSAEDELDNLKQCADLLALKHEAIIERINRLKNKTE